LHDLFPAKEWAIALPVILLVTGGSLVGTFLGMVMVKSNQDKKVQAKAK
jgi:dolichol phosphate-mannose biosynthesis regulatory protein